MLGGGKKKSNNENKPKIVLTCSRYGKLKVCVTSPTCEAVLHVVQLPDWVLGQETAAGLCEL